MGKRFDYEAALSEGYSEREIEDFLKSEGIQHVSKTRSVVSALPKGFIKGARASMNPLSPKIIPSELAENLTEQFLPTRSGNLEDVLQMSGELAPTAALGRGGIFGKLAQLAGGVAAKKSLKELDAPELIQDIGAAVGMVAPGTLKGAFSNKLIPSTAQKEVYDLLKSHGFSDKEITPFIQNKKKISFLSPLAKKSLEKSEIKKGLGEVGDLLYSDIRQRAKKIPPLSFDKKASLIHEIETVSSDIPKHHRKLIQEELHDLLDAPVTYDSIRDFEVALNNKVKGTEGGKAVLNAFKEPMRRARYALDPRLAKETDVANKIYRHGKEFSEKLSEDVVDKILKLGELGTYATAILTLNPAILAPAGVRMASQKVAEKFLTSPRLQGIQKKMLSAVRSGNKNAILRLYTIAMEEISRISNSYSGKKDIRQ